MHVRYITVSDIRENISVDDSIKILTVAPNVEFGIQADGFSMKSNSARNIWLREILDKSNSMQKPLNIALHVNFDWCNAACNFNIPNELANLTQLKHAQTGTPLIQRLQFNIGDGTALQFDVYKLKQLIKYFSQHEIIFPYNSLTKPILDSLDKTHAEFSILNDASYGAGITPKNWPAPAYASRHATGYSGGLSAKNVEECLNSVSKFNLDLRGETWVDAEGKLMKRGVYPRQLNINKAMDYILAASKWQK